MDRGKVHRYKSFLVNALRKGGQGPFFRYWMEETNTSDSPEPDSSSKGARGSPGT